MFSKVALPPCVEVAVSFGVSETLVVGASVAFVVSSGIASFSEAVSLFGLVSDSDVLPELQPVKNKAVRANNVNVFFFM